MATIDTLSAQIPPTNSFNITAPITTGNKTTEKGDGLFGKDGFTFFDFLDIINPLQHLPIISNIYRSITGDHIDPGSKIAGATIFGGPIGGVLASMDLAISRKTGQDIAGHAATFFTGGIKTETTILGQKENTANPEFSNVTNPIGVLFGNNNSVPTGSFTRSPMKQPVGIDSKKKFEAAGMTAIPIANINLGTLTQSKFNLQGGRNGSSAQITTQTDNLQTIRQEKPNRFLQYTDENNEAFLSPRKTSHQFSSRTKNNHAVTLNPNNATFMENHKLIKKDKTDNNKKWVVESMLTGLEKYQSTKSLTDKAQRKRIFINH